MSNFQKKRTYEIIAEKESESPHRSHESSKHRHRHRHHHTSSSRHHSSRKSSDKYDSNRRHCRNSESTKSYKDDSSSLNRDKNGDTKPIQSLNTVLREPHEEVDKDEFKGYQITEAPDFDSSEDELEIQSGVSHILKDDDGHINLNLFQSKDIESKPHIQSDKNKIQTTQEGPLQGNTLPETYENHKISPSLPEKSILDVNYEFGDRGSNWRMMKLNKILEQSKWDPYKSEEEYVFERYGNLDLFYIALEEKEELERRKKSRNKNEWVYKPTGRLIKENSLQSNGKNDETKKSADSITKEITLDEVTEARIAMMRAKLSKANNLGSLEARYTELKALYDEKQKHQTTKSNVNINIPENQMTIDQLVTAENTQTFKSTLKQAAKQIASMKTFYNTDLDQQDDEANKLASLSKKSEISLQEFIENPKLVKALETCRFCKDTKTQSLPSLISTENFYITLMAKPEISGDPGCMIVPLKHLKNSLYLTTQQHAEMVQIMESLSMFYFKEYKSNVIFYEESVFNTAHFAIKCIPVPKSFDSKVVASYFREGIMEQVLENNDTQQKAIIDTSDGYRTKIAKEAPFYRVWFTLDGGFGHIVEDVPSWPRNDGFSRSVIGNFLEAGVFAIRARPKFNLHNKDELAEFGNRLMPYLK